MARKISFNAFSKGQLKDYLDDNRKRGAREWRIGWHPALVRPFSLSCASGKVPLEHVADATRKWAAPAPRENGRALSPRRVQVELPITLDQTLTIRHLAEWVERQTPRAYTWYLKRADKAPVLVLRYAMSEEELEQPPVQQSRRLGGTRSIRGTYSTGATG
jgi:hypothetical protein